VPEARHWEKRAARAALSAMNIAKLPVLLAAKKLQIDAKLNDKAILIPRNRDGCFVRHKKRPPQ
jgi:hypothetical protein